MKLKLYLTINYVKYIVFILSSFILIIWLAQILRFIDFNQSLNIQLVEVIKITSYLIPNAIKAIIPIIILISTFFFNKHLNSTNEVSIFELYLSKKSLSNFLIIINIFIIGFYIINSEIISVNSYNNFKNEEIKFRNEFKITENGNQILIPNKISLFAKNKESRNNFSNVTTFLFEENVVINSEQVSFKQTPSEITFEFVKGQRVSASGKEKSLTNFDKLQYKILNTNKSEVSLGKENYNIVQLFNHKNLNFKKAGHRQIVDLIFLFLILVISRKLILINEKSRDLIKNYLFNLVSILISFTFLSLITKLYITNTFETDYFYLFSLLIITMTYFLLKKNYDFI